MLSPTGEKAMNIKALIITISTITLTLFVAFFAAYGMLKFIERFAWA